MAKAYGSVRSVEKYNRVNGIAEPPKTNEPPKKVKVEASFVIADETVTEVTDEELALLDNIRIKHDPFTVYMQKDLEMYDEFYFSDKEVDNELVKEVRSLRRIYRKYDDYLYACWLRDMYLETIREQYEEEDTTVLKYHKDYQKCTMIPSGVFVPPAPIYSKHAVDYEQVKNGTYSIGNMVSVCSEEDAEAFLQKWIDETGINPNNVQITVDGIMTNRHIINVELSDDELESSRFSGPKSVNVADLDSMQRYMKYWFKKDEEDKDNTRKRVPFPKSEVGMKKLTEIALGLQIMDDYNKSLDKSSNDEDEMVYDESLKKPMTRKEYNRRVSLRLFCDMGDWDIVKIMSQMNIGSKYERRMARHKQKKSNKVKKTTESFFGQFEGDTTDIEELRNYLFAED